MNNVRCDGNRVSVPTVNPMSRLQIARNASVSAIIKIPCYVLPDNRVDYRHHEQDEHKLGRAFKYSEHSTTQPNAPAQRPPANDV